MLEYLYRCLMRTKHRAGGTSLPLRNECYEERETERAVSPAKVSGVLWCNGSSFTARLTVWLLLSFLPPYPPSLGVFNQRPFSTVGETATNTLTSSNNTEETLGNDPCLIPSQGITVFYSGLILVYRTCWQKPAYFITISIKKKCYVLIKMSKLATRFCTFLIDNLKYSVYQRLVCSWYESGVALWSWELVDRLL